MTPLAAALLGATVIPFLTFRNLPASPGWYAAMALVGAVLALGANWVIDNALDDGPGVQR